MTGRPTGRVRTGRRVPPIALALLVAPLAAVLGVFGYAEAFPRLSFTDTVYRSLQLFALDAQIPARGGTPWQLDVARFSAPLAVVYAAVVGAIALLRSRYDAWRVRLWAKDHVIVVGMGDAGVRILRGLRRDRSALVVALELDPRNPYVTAARSYGARVVVGDATSPSVLQRVGVGRARHVVIASGDDSLNLEVVAAVRASVGVGRRRVHVHVLLDHLELWRELNRVRLLVESDSINVEYVHLPDRSARRLLASVHAAGAPSSARVLVEGDSSLAARTAAHFVRRTLCDGLDPALVAGLDLQQRLAAEEAWLRPYLVAAEASGEPDVVLVCSGPEGDAASIARGLRLAGEHRSADVLVTVDHESVADVLEVDGSHGRRVRLVPPRVDELGRELTALSAVELIAQARHAGYVAQQEAQGVRPEDNSSLRPWNDLPEPLKTSNRRYAESMAVPLAELGAELVPLTGAPPAGDVWLPLDRVDLLAELEHERWVRDLVADGWRRTDGAKDPQAQLHPLLVPWDDLDEADREKDRQSVRDLPAMLARVGYAIVVPPRG